MIHQTSVSITDSRQGPVYLRFGTVDGQTLPDGSRMVAVGMELSSNTPSTTLRVQLIMSIAEAIQLSDELRRLAFDTNNKTRL